MRIRHLKYFLAVAEELNFSRASTRVHIERSSLAHAIHDLESQLGAELFTRTNKGIQLTWPGEVLLDDVRRMLSCFENAKERVRAASNGYLGRIRIGLADSLAQPRLANLLARTREEEPNTEIRIFDMSASEIMRALHHNLIDIGITVNDECPSGYTKYPVWSERPAVAIPTHHPLLMASKVSLKEALQHRLILCHPEKCAGGFQIISRWFYNEKLSLPVIAEHATGHEQMLMLVAAGYGIGIGLTSQLAVFSHPDVVIRPMHEDVPDVSTFFVTREDESDPAIARLFQRAEALHV